MSILQIDTPRWAKPLLRPARYKGAHGGRGSGKSHFFAELLIERCFLQRTRAVCVREFQKSLKNSVKQLLLDKIAALGLGDFFDASTETEIRGRNGSLIVFVGMQNHTADSFKSFEGFDVAWVEEAQSLSSRSLRVLTPTMRKKGAEMWFSWNPGRADDPVDLLLRGASPPDDSIVIQVNWRDNPWFPPALREDMERDRERDPDLAAHVWDGKYLVKSKATVFRRWRIEAFETPDSAVHRFGADWGFANDPTVLVRNHIVGRELRVDHCVAGVGIDIDETPAFFEKVPGVRDWLITADSARPETISYMRKRGFRMRPAIKGPGSIEEGVRFLKGYDIVVHPRCDPLLAEELTKYAFRVDPQTEEILPLLDDLYNNTIDALRYGNEGAMRAGKPQLPPPPRARPDYGLGRDAGVINWKTV
ncbi:MAG: PBSX family phage terminase large subunit [Bosea sp. (in: a-proteobacteria)]